MHINFKLLKNDFKKNRTGNVSLLLFMTLSVGLVVVSTIVLTQLITSMVGMYSTAKPPHFLQMHKGEINEQKIDEFNSSYEGVTAWQTIAMIDVYGDDIKVYGNDVFSLSECRLDISLVKQNKEYDLLLNKDREKIGVNKGEIGIPVILLDSYDIKLGDTVVLTSNGITKEFKVTAFAHDAQMNSTLCSSTRILISDEDFEELFGIVGENEYLIEVYFKNISMVSDYKTAYEKADLPEDGQSVTYTVIFILSAFRDIAMSMVLIIVSILLVLIALMCIKYTVMATLEEELCEIGTMKAIGMSYKDIRNLYLLKYKIMVIAAIVIGYVLARIMSGIFTAHVSDTFGKQPISALTLGLPLGACVFMYIITDHFCKKIFKKLKKVTVVDTLVTKKGFGKGERVKDGLYKSKTMPVNFLLGLREILNNFNGFVIVFVVMFIVSGIMVVPMNLSNTMESKEFISYMGSSMEDILIEIDSGKNLEKRYETIKKLLKEDTSIDQYKEFKRVRVEAINSQGKWINLNVDSGTYAGKDLKYLDGKAPTRDNEIALSKLNADEMEKNIGDSIISRFNGIEKRFIIIGIYQDVTSGGYTAKAIYNFAGVDIQKYQFTVNFNNGVDAGEKATQWSNKLGGGYDIEPMEEFIKQTLGGVTRQIKVATTAVVIIGLLLAALIIVLFMKLRLAKDVAQISIMKVIGFKDSDVRKQYLYKIGIVSIAGIVTGTFVSNLLGESLVSMVLSILGFGISRIKFIINPWNAFVISPLVLLLVAASMTWISTKQIEKYNIISLINE